MTSVGEPVTPTELLPGFMIGNDPLMLVLILCCQSVSVHRFTVNIDVIGNDRRDRIASDLNPKSPRTFNVN